MDLALDNQQRLIYANQPTNQPTIFIFELEIYCEERYKKN